MELYHYETREQACKHVRTTKIIKKLNYSNIVGRDENHINTQKNGVGYIFMKNFRKEHAMAISLCVHTELIEKFLQNNKKTVLCDINLRGFRETTQME